MRDDRLILPASSEAAPRAHGVVPEEGHRAETEGYRDDRRICRRLGRHRWLLVGGRFLQRRRQFRRWWRLGQRV